MPPLRSSIGRIAPYLFCAGLIIILMGCGKKEGAELNISNDTAREAADLKRPKNEEILATIGDEIITVDDYKKEIAMLPSNYRAMVKLNKNQFLEGLINKRLLLRGAKRENLQNSENVKRLFEKVKEEIMVQEFIDRKIGGKAEATESEIEKYYHANQNNYMESAKIRASHILVDSELLAKKILSDLERGVNFAELAKEYSLDIPTKEKGGDIGYFAKGTLIPEFEEACEKLDVGEISDILKTDLGYHIIKVMDKKEAQLKKLDELKNEIKSKLLLEKELELYNSLLLELKKDREITINNQLLESIDLTQID